MAENPHAVYNVLHHSPTLFFWYRKFLKYYFLNFSPIMKMKGVAI